MAERCADLWDVSFWRVFGADAAAVRADVGILRFAIPVGLDRGRQRQGGPARRDDGVAVRHGGVLPPPADVWKPVPHTGTGVDSAWPQAPPPMALGIAAAVRALGELPSIANTGPDCDGSVLDLFADRFSNR